MRLSSSAVNRSTLCERSDLFSDSSPPPHARGLGNAITSSFDHSGGMSINVALVIVKRANARVDVFLYASSGRIILRRVRARVQIRIRIADSFALISSVCELVVVREGEVAECLPGRSLESCCTGCLILIYRPKV